MLYSDLITALRKQTGDVSRPVHVDFTADGITTIFQLPVDCFPVLDQVGTYQLAKNGTVLSEGGDYSIDKDAGFITMTVMPNANDILAWDGRAIWLTDASWLSIINDTIKSLGFDFFIEFTDMTNFVSVFQALTLDITSIYPNVFAVYQLAMRTSASDDFIGLENYANWRFSRDDKQIYIGSQNGFYASGFQIKVRGLQSYTLGTVVTATIDVQDAYMTIIQYGSIARYWKWRYKSVVELVSKMTQEATRTPLQELMMLSDRFERDYESEKARLKPQKPALVIPVYKEGGGRP